MLQLRGYYPDSNHLLELESIQLRDDLTFHVPLARIMDKGVKQLRNKSAQLVKVACRKEGPEDYTWELESDIRTI